LDAALSRVAFMSLLAIFFVTGVFPIALTFARLLLLPFWLFELLQVIGFGKVVCCLGIQRLPEDISKSLELSLLNLPLGRKLDFEHNDQISLRHRILVERHSLPFNDFSLVWY
jgi:hypothetical protein